MSVIVGFSNRGYLLCDLIFSSFLQVCLSSFPMGFQSTILSLPLVHFMGFLYDFFIHDLWFGHSHSDFYLCNLFFLHELSLIYAFSLFTSHLVKWVSASFSATYLTLFLSASLCIFLSHLPHDFLSISSYRFFLCVGVLSQEWPWVYSSSVDCELLNMTVRGYQYDWVSLVLSDYVSLAWLFWTWLNYSSLCFWLKPLFLLTKSLRSVSVCFNPLSRYVYGLPYLTSPFSDNIKLWVWGFK